MKNRDLKSLNSKLETRNSELSLVAFVPLTVAGQQWIYTTFP
jgi:hypothetical protein